MRSVVGFDGSTVVERTPHNQEFAGLNPTECLALSFLLAGFLNKEGVFKLISLKYGYKAIMSLVKF